MDRRYFLKSSGITLASFGLMAAAPEFLHQFANAQTLTDRNGKKKILITIFQRGAVDGLNMVVPYGDSEYYNLRSSIAIQAPNKTDGAVNLDGYFGLHPSLKPFEALWNNKQLAVIHSAGSPDTTRSHFDAQDYMESGTPGNKSFSDGWLNRYLQLNPEQDASAFRAVALTATVPRSLAGSAPSVAMQRVSDFGIRGGRATPEIEELFADLYKDTFDAVKTLRSATSQQYTPAEGVQYPNSPFSQSLQQIAQLIKSNVGVEVAFAELGGWDTHANQGSSRGQLANQLRNFG